MPLPPYNDFLFVEGPVTLADYRAATGHDPAYTDRDHVAYRRLAEGWSHRDVRKAIYTDVGAPLPPDLIDPEPVPIPGRLGNPRGNTYQFVDDTGGWLLLGTTLFWAAFGEIHEPDRVDAHFDYFRSKQIHDARVIACGLRKGTLERSLDPWKDEFQRGVAGVTDRALTFGRRIDWTIFGATYPAPSKAQRRQTVRNFCDALKGRTHGVTGIEIANEGWKNGFEGDAGRDELKELVALVHELLPEVLVAPTCPAAGDDITDAMIEYYYKGTASSWVVEHHARKIAPPDGIYRPTKKPWREFNFDTPGCPKLRRNREPRGQNSSVSRTADPLVLATDLIVTYVSGEGGYTWHTGAGIYGVAYDSPYGHRPANVWESENAEATTTAFQACLALLPASLPNYRKHKSNQGPFRYNDPPGEDLAAAYSATAGAPTVPGEHIVQPIWGIVRGNRVTLQGGRCEGHVYNPRDGSVLADFDQAFSISPSQPSVLAIATRI